MLTGEKDVDSGNISKPATISDFMDLKIRSMRRENNLAFAPSSKLISTIMAQNSPLLSQETTRCSITFTAISDRE
jgi:hypothetical protein